MRNLSSAFLQKKNRNIVILETNGSFFLLQLDLQLKVAVVKALGTGISGGGLWTDIEILPDDDGAPHVKLYGYFAYIATKRKIYNIFISLSHCKEYAVAQAILEG